MIRQDFTFKTTPKKKHKSGVVVHEVTIFGKKYNWVDTSNYVNKTQPVIVCITNKDEDRLVQDVCFNRGRTWACGSSEYVDMFDIWGNKMYYLVVEDLIIYYGGSEIVDDSVGFTKNSRAESKDHTMYTVKDFLEAWD